MVERKEVCVMRAAPKIAFLGACVMAVGMHYFPSPKEVEDASVLQKNKAPPPLFEDYSRGGECVDGVIDRYMAYYESTHFNHSLWNTIRLEIDRDIRVICLHEDPKLWE